MYILSPHYEVSECKVPSDTTMNVKKWHYGQMTNIHSFLVMLERVKEQNNLFGKQEIQKRWNFELKGYGFKLT